MHADARRRGALAHDDDRVARRIPRRRAAARVPRPRAMSRPRAARAPPRADAAPGPRSPPELRRALRRRPRRCPSAASTRTSSQTLDGVVAIPSVPDSNALIAGGSDADRFVMGLLRACGGRRPDRQRDAAGSARGRWRPDTRLPGRRRAYAELRRDLGLEPRAAASRSSPRRGRSRSTTPCSRMRRSS